MDNGVGKDMKIKREGVRHEEEGEEIYEQDGRMGGVRKMEMEKKINGKG